MEYTYYYFLSGTGDSFKHSIAALDLNGDPVVILSLLRLAMKVNPDFDTIVMVRGDDLKIGFTRDGVIAKAQLSQLEHYLAEMKRITN